MNKQLHNTHNKAKSTDNCHAHGPICQPPSIIGSATNEQGSGVSLCIFIDNNASRLSTVLRDSVILRDTRSRHGCSFY